MKIDFVITWVDGNDPIWLAEKERFKPGSAADSRKQRYRDWDNLQYWFRAVEKFAPWVHRIFFVTYGHYPTWLNINHPKLRIVKHTDYIPTEYLPTFSSRAIDMNFHRIKELSEHFVYFNDDMFILQPVEPKDFFVNGLPCDTAIMNALYFGFSEKKYGEKTPRGVDYMAPAMDMFPINRNFDKRVSIKNNLGKWFSPNYGIQSLRTLLLMPWEAFTGFMSYHLPYSYLKSTYSEVWEKEKELLSESCSHKFRVSTDVNHWVFSYWQLAKGSFSPRSPKVGQQFGIYSDSKKNEPAISAIRTQKFKFICLNDSVSGNNFDVIKNALNSELASLLPKKSEFER